MPEDTRMTEFLPSETEWLTESEVELQRTVSLLASAEEWARTAGHIATAEALRKLLEEAQEELRLCSAGK
jgi:hypothetical protein